MSEKSGKPAKTNTTTDAGSPSCPNIIQIPTNTNEPPRLIRAMRAVRNGNELNLNLPLPLDLFDDEEINIPEHLGPENFANPFLNDLPEIPENNEPAANAANPASNSFGGKMCSLKKFIKKYMKLGRSRKHAIAKYHKANLHFG